MYLPCVAICNHGWYALCVELQLQLQCWLSAPAHRPVLTGSRSLRPSSIPATGIDVARTGINIQLLATTALELEMLSVSAEISNQHLLQQYSSSCSTTGSSCLIYLASGILVFTYSVGTAVSPSTDDNQYR